RESFLLGAAADYRLARLIRGNDWPLAQADLDVLALAVAPDLDRDLRTRLDRRHRPREVVGIVHRRVAQPRDDVAAGAELAPPGRRAVRAAAQAGLRRGAAGAHALHPGAVLDRQVEALHELGIQRDRLDAQVRVADLAAVAQLGDRALGDVDRD